MSGAPQGGEEAFQAPRAFEAPRRPLVDAALQLDVVACLFYDYRTNSAKEAALPEDEDAFSWYEALRATFPDSPAFARHLAEVYLDPGTDAASRELAVDFLELEMEVSERRADAFDALLTQTGLFASTQLYNHSQPDALSEAGFHRITEVLFACLPQYLEKEASVSFFRKILLYLGRCPYKAKITSELMNLYNRTGNRLLRSVLKKARGSDDLIGALVLTLPELLCHYPPEYSFGHDEEFEELYSVFAAYLLRNEICPVLNDMCSYTSLWAVDEKAPNPDAAYGSYTMDSIIALACGLASSAKAYISSRRATCPLLLFAPFRENSLFRQFFGLDAPALDSIVGEKITVGDAQAYYERIRELLPEGDPASCTHDLDSRTLLQAALAGKRKVYLQSFEMFVHSKRGPIGEFVATVYSYPFLLLMKNLSDQIGGPVTESVMTNETLLFGLAASAVNLAYASSLGRATDCNNEVAMIHAQMESDMRKGLLPNAALEARVKLLEAFSEHARACIGQKYVCESVLPFMKSFFGLLGAFSRAQPRGEYSIPTLSVDFDRLTALPMRSNDPPDVPPDQALPSSCLSRETRRVLQSHPAVPSVLWFLPVTMIHVVPQLVDRAGVPPFLARPGGQGVDPGYWMVVDYFNAALRSAWVGPRQMSTRLCVEALTDLLGIHSYINDPAFHELDRTFGMSMLSGAQSLPLGVGFSDVFENAPVPVLQRSLAALLKYFASDMNVYPMSMLFPHTVFYQGYCHAYNVARDPGLGVLHAVEGEGDFGAPGGQGLLETRGSGGSPSSPSSPGAAHGVFIWTPETIGEVPFMEAFLLALAGEPAGWASVGGREAGEDARDARLASLRAKLERAYGKIFSSAEELRALPPGTRLPDNASAYLTSLISLLSAILVESNRFLTDYQAYLSGKTPDASAPGAKSAAPRLNYADAHAVGQQITQLTFYSYMYAIPCVLCALCPQVVLFDTNLISIVSNMITIIDMMKIFRAPEVHWQRGVDLLQLASRRLGERWKAFLYLASQGLSRFAAFMGAGYSSELVEIIYGAMPPHFADSLRELISEGLVELDPGFLRLVRACGLSSEDIAERLEGEERARFEEAAERYTCQLMATPLRNPLVLHQSGDDMYIVDRASIVEYLKTTGKNPVTQQEVTLEELRPPPESWMRGFREFQTWVYELRSRFTSEEG